MTFGVIETEVPFLADLIALAFESADHDCLVFKDVDHATRILNAIHVDSIVLDIHMPGRNALDWLEGMTNRWPDLPSRTLLFTHAALTPDEAARIKRLGAEVVFRPFSFVGVKQVVRGRLLKARSEQPGGLCEAARRRWPRRALEAAGHGATGPVRGAEIG